MTLKSIDEWIKEQEEICEKASKEPWAHKKEEALEKDCTCLSCYRFTGHYTLETSIDSVGPFEKKEDALYCSNARTALPKALNLLKKYRNYLTEITKNSCCNICECSACLAKEALEGE